jgi:ribosomal protein S26
MLCGGIQESAGFTRMGCDHCGRASPCALARKRWILRNEIERIGIEHDR